MAQGRKGHIGMAKETTFGTPVAAARYHRFRRENVVTAIEEVTPPNILGVFDEGPTYQGLKTHSGPIDADVHPVFLGEYLLGGIGPVSTTTLEAMVRFQHDFAVRQTEFSVDSIMQPYTMEIHRDLGQAFQYTGANFNRLTFQFGIGSKVLGMTAELIAKSMTRITATTPTFESTQAFRWNQASIELPDTTQIFTVRDITVGIDNGLAGKAYIDGTQEIRRVRAEGSRVVTVSGTVLASTAEFDEFISGSERAMEITFVGAVLGAGNIRLEFLLPRFRYTAYPVATESPDEIEITFNGKAKYDGGVANSPLRVRLVNGQATY